MDVYLADLRRLAVPFGGTTDRILECAFMPGLPNDVSRLLRASLRLNKLGIDELLARTRNILKDTELVAAAARTTETPSERQYAAGDSAVPRPESSKCYRCGGLNHYSRDCRGWGNTGGANDQKTPGPHSAELFRKRVRGQGAVASLAPSWPVNAVLPVIKVQVDGVQCSALVDTGCSRSIVSADRCTAWSNQQVDMRTINRTSHACCGVGTVSILTNGSGHTVVNV